jgi:hypothetical protein
MLKTRKEVAMNMNHLVNRLHDEKAALEHSGAVDQFLRETEYLREKPARRRFSGSRARWIITLLGVSLIAFAAFSLLQ